MKSGYSYPCLVIDQNLSLTFKSYLVVGGVILGSLDWMI